MSAITKAVFDTNIFVSGIFWKGPPYRCVMAAEAGLVLLVLSDSIVSELRQKLTDKFSVPTEEVDALINRLEARAERVPAQGRSGWVPQDPDDDKFIDAALASGADRRHARSADPQLLRRGSWLGLGRDRARVAGPQESCRCSFVGSRR